MRYNREKKELTFDEAKDKALRLLEFRSHSERELSAIRPDYACLL